MRLLKKIEFYYKYDLRYKPKEFICWLFGHRKVVVLLHSEICDHPWNAEHVEKTKDTIDAFCRYCDSGWLIQRPTGRWGYEK